MKLNKVIEVYRPNTSWIGFYIMLKIYLIVNILAIHYLKETGYLTTAEISRALMNFAFDSYLIIGFLCFFIMEMFFSMFQWIKAKRKNKDPYIQILNIMAKEINKK